MAKRSSALSNVIVLVVLVYLGYNFFKSDHPTPSQPSAAPPAQADSQNKKASPSKPTYALRPDNSWPPASDQGEAPDPQGLTTSNYYLILDASGSMGETRCSGNQPKIQVAVDAVSAFAQSLPKQANFGLAVFANSQLQELRPLSPSSNQGLNKLQSVRPSGGTPLKDALQFGYQHLLAQGQRQQGYGEYHLVLVTDGLASKGQDPRRMVESILGESPVVLHTIGFCIRSHHVLNQPGRIYYRSATDPEGLRQGLDSVLAEAPAFAVDQFQP
jgi:hypothetical protein